MSCTFWNMRRRLKAQAAQKDKIITDIAAAQAKEKAVEKKPKETAVKKDDNKRTGRKA